MKTATWAPAISFPAPVGLAWQPTLVSRAQWRCWKVDQREGASVSKGTSKVNYRSLRDDWNQTGGGSALISLKKIKRLSWHCGCDNLLDFLNIFSRADKELEVGSL